MSEPMNTACGSEVRSPLTGERAAQAAANTPAGAGRCPPAAPASPGRRALRVLHETHYHYDAPVELAHHVAHLRPRLTPLQHIRHWRLDIDPAVDPQAPAAAPRRPEGEGGRVEPGETAEMPVSLPAGVHQSQDVWGNWRASFSHTRVHDHLRVASRFVAEIAAAPPLQLACGPAWEKVAAGLRYQPGGAHDEAVEFTLPSVYAPRDAALARLAREAFVPSLPVVAGAMALTQLIYRRFEYRPSATSVATRAPEALAQRRGVCQDFAHVMIGAMRSIGLAARYVSGYLLTQPPPGQPRLIGADASHAWVSVWCPQLGWVALDPTNGVPAGQDHVTLAWGRDYADVAPLRGVIRGGGRAQPRVSVTVEPLP